MSASVFMQIGNLFMGGILRTPLHGMLSGNTMLVMVRGRKSGKPITTPVNYTREGNVIRATSLRGRTWWRNLRGGAEVTLRLQGRDLTGRGTVVEDEASVTTELTAHLRAAPQMAQYMGVTLDADGQPKRAAVERLARERVVVRIVV